MKKLLFVLLLFFVWVRESSAQKDTVLYLYFDPSDKRQNLIKNRFTATVDERHTYYADWYCYRMYMLFQGRDVCFVTKPRKASWTISLRGLKQFQPIDIHTLVDRIKKLNENDIYWKTGDNYFLNLKEIYMVETDKVSQKARIIAVDLKRYIE